MPVLLVYVGLVRVGVAQQINHGCARIWLGVRACVPETVGTPISGIFVIRRAISHNTNTPHFPACTYHRMSYIRSTTFLHLHNTEHTTRMHIRI